MSHFGNGGVIESIIISDMILQGFSFGVALTMLMTWVVILLNIWLYAETI